jgi:hypothetical protein
MGQRDKWAMKLVVAACALLAAGATGAQEATQKTVKEWQDLAQADLDAVRELIRTAHPGALDKQNPDFARLMAAGYEEARRDVARVTDYNSMMAAVRGYVTSFRDGHLVYSDNARRPHYTIAVNGIMFALADGEYRVAANLDNWPVPLPPVGSVLLSCDGLSPQQLIETRYAPYFDRRPSQAAAEVLAGQLHSRAFADAELKRCRYRTQDGKALELAVAYKPFQTREYFDQVLPMMAKARPARPASRANRYRFDGGILWIEAPNFSLRGGSAEAKDLDKMLVEIGALSGVKTIVFDVRGNGGGDSRIGGRILNAATGGLNVDMKNLEGIPRTYAEWRVSDVAIQTASSHVERMTKLYGADSSQVRMARDMLNQFEGARAAGQAWVRQDAEHLLTPEEVARRGGRLNRFAGTVALLTDNRCASACLDFADSVRLIPGAIHLGQTTGADTVYIDTGRATLPSGNVLVLPLKVWRNRLRGNNQPWTPHIPLAVDMADDAAVRQAVLAALSKAEQTR